MKIDKLFDQFNHRDTLLVVSPYPKKGETYSSGTTGVASYTKNVVSNMDRKVIVLADIKRDDKDPSKRMYQEGNVLVIRCFRTRSLLIWLDVLKNIQRFDAVTNVLLQHDFGMYGGQIILSLFLIFLGILKFTNKHVSVTLHHVVTNVFMLKGHMGIGNSLYDLFKGDLYNLMFRTYYRILGGLADSAIVLEETLKKKLTPYIHDRKIIAIPHGVDTRITVPNKKASRKALGMNQKDFVVMFFGYVNWFKGADIFARVFGNKHKILGKEAHFIIAGGLSPTMKHKWHYQKFFGRVQNTVANAPSLTMTGYIPQRDLGKYFAAADLVVFPYRHFMTASGVLSLTFSYKKPFLISDELKEMFLAEDFNDALHQAKLTHDDVVFSLNKHSMLETTNNVLANGIKRKMAKMAEILRLKRSYRKTAKLYEYALFAPKFRLHSSPALGYTHIHEA